MTRNVLLSLRIGNVDRHVARDADAEPRRRAPPLRLEPLFLSCHGPDRSHLIVPGFRSSRIHIVNVADDPRAPRIEKVIEPDEILAKTGYTRPHTVHCMPGDNVVISMLGDADGNGAGGFAMLDAKTFEVRLRQIRSAYVIEPARSCLSVAAASR